MKGSRSILLGAWFRFHAAEHWRDVLRAEPLWIDDSSKGFLLAAYYDPGPIGSDSREPSVVFIGYLRDQVSEAIADALKGTPRPPSRLSVEASEDGLGGLPVEYARYLRAKADLIGSLATNAYDMLRWRHGVLDGPTNLSIFVGHLFWVEASTFRVDVDLLTLDWRQVSTGAVLLDVPPGNMLDLRPEAGERVTKLIADGYEAPLQHSLFREAWRLRKGSPRSSLVMAIAAAETAVKTFIKNVAPATTWLVENVPSPPISKLLKDFIPTLPSRATDSPMVPLISHDVRRALSEGVEQRNRIVHGLPIELNAAQLSHVLDAVLEVLHFLDLHLGHSWVKALPANMSEQCFSGSRSVIHLAARY